MTEVNEQTGMELVPATTAPQNGGGISEPRWTDADLEALKATVAKGCNDAQFRVFMGAARRLGLDPFARQIVPIVQGGGMTPQVTIDGFRLIAERTGRYAGQLGPFWCGPDGQWREVWLEDGPPAGARVGVLRRDFDQPVWGVARYKSYDKGGNWRSMPDVMLAKVAESLALRKAFPQELSGVYTDDEMGGADNPPHVVEAAPPPVRVQPEPAPAPTRKPAAKGKPATSEQLERIRRGCELLGQPVPEGPQTMESADKLIATLRTMYQERQAKAAALAEEAADEGDADEAARRDYELSGAFGTRGA